MTRRRSPGGPGHAGDLRARGLAARIDAATPAGRDRTVDALRALAITGVILGHWMVTALVLTQGRSATRCTTRARWPACPR